MREDRPITVWALTQVEVVSAVRRLERDHNISAKAASTALLRMEALRKHWVEIAVSDPLVDRALRLLAVHPLTAGDALQLAAALEFVADRPRHHRFITADRRLAEAATRTGFDVTDLTE